MTTDFFKDLTDKTKENIAPFVKFNELMSASIQNLFQAQMAATQRYSEMSMAQVKAATEIRDMDSLQSFFQSQVGTFEALNEQVMADLKAMADASVSFRQELEGIFFPGSEAQTEKESQSVKKTTSKAATKSKESASEKA